MVSTFKTFFMLWSYWLMTNPYQRFIVTTTCMAIMTIIANATFLLIGYLSIRKTLKSVLSHFTEQGLTQTFLIRKRN